MALTFHELMSKLGRETPSCIRALSLIHNKKTTVLFERHCHATEKPEAHCMCKELPVVPVNKVVDPKRVIRKKWRAEEEERHKWLLTPQKCRTN
jgi:hypothetical protein